MKEIEICKKCRHAKWNTEQCVCVVEIDKYRWTQDEVRKLIVLVNQGKHTKEISDALGRMPTSVRRKARSIGIEIVKRPPLVATVIKVQLYCKARDCDNPCLESFCSQECCKYHSRTYISESREEYLTRINKNK